LAIGRRIGLRVSFCCRVPCLLQGLLRRSTRFGGIVENGRSYGIGLVRRFLKLLFVRLTAGAEQRGNGEDHRKTHRDLGFGSRCQWTCRKGVPEISYTHPFTRRKIGLYRLHPTNRRLRRTVTCARGFSRPLRDRARTAHGPHELERKNGDSAPNSTPAGAGEPSWAPASVRELRLQRREDNGNQGDRRTS